MIAEWVAAVALAIWIYLLWGRGGFWLEFRRQLPPPELLGPAPSVVVIIPARDEASVVGHSVASLCKQEFAGRLHIVVVDDGSEDGTAAAAREAAPADVLTVIRAAPMPEGWSGKLWAVAEGVREAERRLPDFLLLTDADIVHGPGVLAGLVARAESGYHLVSYMATLQCRTIAEKMLVPGFVFFFFMLYPPAWVRDANRRTAGAAGGCILIRRTVLDGIGGIASIRGALIDDCALARAVKGQGSRVWLSLGREVYSIRPYTSFGEIGRMISRTAFTQLNHSALLLGGTVLGMALTYVAPPLFSLTGGTQLAGMGSMAWLLMSVAYLPALRFYRRSPLWAIFLPLVALFYLGATVHSAVAYWRGSGGMWKGRVQDAR